MVSNLKSETARANAQSPTVGETGCHGVRTRSNGIQRLGKQKMRNEPEPGERPPNQRFEDMPGGIFGRTQGFRNSKSQSGLYFHTVKAVFTPCRAN
jgi:hypothetical protein